jgi:predicted hydrocarbon binding protein
VRPEFDASRNLLTLGGSQLVFHCHHYNLHLQRTVDEALGADAGRALQRSAAGESARRMLSALFASQPREERLASASALFSQLGFGLSDITALSESGGRVVLVTSHYAVGWRSKWGDPPRAVCHFATGYWAGALSAATGLEPERIVADEVQCAAAGAESCIIELEVR